MSSRHISKDSKVGPNSGITPLNADALSLKKNHVVDSEILQDIIKILKSSKDSDSPDA